MVQHRSARLRLIWFTTAALFLAALLAILGPDSKAVGIFPFMGSGAAAQKLRSYPNDPGRLSLLRANYLADMLFLLAYGFLLRETFRSREVLARFRGQAKKLAPVIRTGLTLTVLLMVSDTLENLFALGVLGLLPYREPPHTLFSALAVASRLKWLCGTPVLTLAGALWWHHTQGPRTGGGRGLRHWTVYAVSVFFVLGGAASLGVVILSFGNHASALTCAAGIAVAAPAIALFLQIVLWGSLGLLGRLVYFLRVPLACIALLTAFGPIAAGPVRNFLVAILAFSGSQWPQLAITAMVAFLVAFAAVAQCNLVLRNGPERFGDETLFGIDDERLRTAIRWSATAAAALPIFSGVAIGLIEPAQGALWNVAGFLGAIAVLLIAEWLQNRFAKPNTPVRQLVFPTATWPVIGPWLKKARARNQPPVIRGLVSLVKKIFTKLFVASGRGYAYPNGALYLGHVFALCLAGLSLAVYFFVLYIGAPGRRQVATLTCVLLLVMAAGWMLSGLAFLLDRFRIPLLTGVVGLWALLGLFPYTDHVFRLGRRATGDKPPSPSLVLAAHADPVVVAAAGGGIQAAAWTTRVLQGVDEAWGGALRKRVALLSTVSGGSVGAVYAGAWFDKQNNWAEAATRARLSSLDEIAWGLAGPDVLRPLLFMPRMRPMDRGYALERTIQRRMPDGEQTLADWAKRAGKGDFPAFLFNTTVVETGQPLAFATSDFPTDDYRKSRLTELRALPVVESAAHKYGLDDDVRAATAARLSAAFPYVSPAARPQWESANPRNFHLVDGGYYDNYGLVSLSQWLDDALTSFKGTRPTRITVLVIRDTVYAPRADAATWTWEKQPGAPISTFLQVRNYGQWAGGVEALQLLMEKWAHWPGHPVQIEPHLLEYPDMNGEKLQACSEPPLTWKLTPEQSECIDKAWETVKSKGVVPRP
jgi:hypothetical protein